MTAREPEMPQPGATTAAAGEGNVPPAPGHPPSIAPALDGTPEAVITKTADAHGDNQFIQQLRRRLDRGLNFRSGSCLADIRELAYRVYLDGDDTPNALAICRLITELPYDGNPGRWAPIEACLALASYITAQAGQSGLADIYAEKLRAPDHDEQDAFRAKVNARVRQRTLNEPNLYDKEIARASAKTDRKSEMEWRRLRLNTLLHLRAHAGSETFSVEDLTRRIGNELIELRR